MTCRETTHAEVLMAVRDRLLNVFPELNPATCFLSMDPEPDIAVSHNLFLTIAPTGGVFDRDFITGAGKYGCAEESGIIVSVWSTILLDKLQQYEIALTESTRGLLAWKHKILAALTSHDLANASGDKLLMNYMKPVTSDHPKQAMYRDGRVGFSLAFETDFVWNLASAGVES